MADLFTLLAEAKDHFPPVLELRVSSGLVIAGLLALRLWLGQRGSR